jgi:hypothetical protein
MFQKGDIIKIKKLSSVWINYGLKNNKNRETLTRSALITSLSPFFYESRTLREEIGIILNEFHYPESQRLFINELYCSSYCSSPRIYIENYIKNKTSVYEVYLLNNITDKQKNIFVWEDCFIVGL